MRAGGIKDPKARVILNDIGTEWFKCPLGVKQGDVISPTLFAIYIDDLVSELRELGVGIKIGDDIINSLLYADDIVLIAANEDDLQLLLKKLNSWCSKWSPEANMLKANVMYSCMLGTLNLRYLNLVSSLKAKR